MSAPRWGGAVRKKFWWPLGIFGRNALDTYVWTHIGPFWRKNGPWVNNSGFRIWPVFTKRNVFGPQIPLGKAEESVWGVICDPPKGTSDHPGWGPLLQGVWAGGVKKGQNLTHFSANFHSMCPVLEGWKLGYLEFLDKKIFWDWFRDGWECFRPVVAFRTRVIFFHANFSNGYFSVNSLHTDMVGGSKFCIRVKFFAEIMKMRENASRASPAHSGFTM